MTRTEGIEQVPALMGGLVEEASSRKGIFIFFFPIGPATQKTLLDKFPAIWIAIKILPELLDRCTQTFLVERNRTFNRLYSFSRKQKPKRSLQHLYISGVR